MFCFVYHCFLLSVKMLLYKPSWSLDIGNCVFMHHTWDTGTFTSWSPVPRVQAPWYTTYSFQQRLCFCPRCSLRAGYIIYVIQGIHEHYLNLAWNSVPLSDVLFHYSPRQSLLSFSRKFNIISKMSSGFHETVVNK